MHLSFFEWSSSKPQSTFRCLPSTERHMRLLPAFLRFVVRRRTILASSNRRDWPADRDLHEALTRGSLALELMSSPDKTPACQSPSARLIFPLTFRHLYEISSFQLTSSTKLVLAYPNLGSIDSAEPHPAALRFFVIFLRPVYNKKIH